MMHIKRPYSASAIIHYENHTLNYSVNEVISYLKTIYWKYVLISDACIRFGFALPKCENEKRVTLARNSEM